ncbi:hypothetical protein [Mitsuokella multacida]|uniref:hypothetical protein n=1 Tax=Mitsuokella multacida TaxID=52226 RepID=UPI0026DAD71C|nr:hypothetical protein [Mitsuokella multacida]
MVIYHESITYHYEFPLEMSYEEQFRICYHREATAEDRGKYFPFLECKSLEEAKNNVEKYGGGEVYKSDRKLTDEGTINEFCRIIPAPPPMTIQGKTLEEWLGR